MRLLRTYWRCNQKCLEENKNVGLRVEQGKVVQNPLDKSKLITNVMTSQQWFLLLFNDVIGMCIVYNHQTLDSLKSFTWPEVELVINKLLFTVFTSQIFFRNKTYTFSQNLAQVFWPEINEQIDSLSLYGL